MALVGQQKGAIAAGTQPALVWLEVAGHGLGFEDMQLVNLCAVILVEVQVEAQVEAQVEVRVEVRVGLQAGVQVLELEQPLVLGRPAGAFLVVLYAMTLADSTHQSPP